jgi:hypothetical protein
MSALRFISLLSLSLLLLAGAPALAQDAQEEETPDELGGGSQEDPEPELATPADEVLQTTAAEEPAPEPSQEEPAQEDPEPEVAVDGAVVYDRLLAAAVTLGIDTPFGIAGASVEITPFRYLAVYAGVGVGRDGVRFGGGLHGRAPVGNAALGLMLGLTGGPLDWDSLARDDAMGIHRWWEMALFFNAGVTFEYRWSEGFFGRLAFGVDALIEPTTATSCMYDNGTQCNGENMFAPVRGWAGLTLGYAFAL